MTQIIEWELDIHVRRDTFSYARFATHLQYLLKRIFTMQYTNTDNLHVYCSVREEYPEIASCVDRIDGYCKQSWSVSLTEEERLYLIMHVNRVCAKEGL